ncbi:phosphotransferase family protein [Endozoicomonas arenosclerae]|uniref:phosphotransferase family protein n=1 Tax=Endozoicomonas arenosclerae TaxID=1633495 RepID=UPI000785D150|nr:aminoglycoside phosphotransferase family protein [Endozoicomonas arenosclerae]
MTLSELIDGISRHQKDQEKVVTAALILRLLYHWQSLDIDTDEKDVHYARQWSSETIRLWIDNIQSWDQEWITATVASDPFNLLAGFSVLPDSDAEAAIQTYCQLCQTLKKEHQLTIIAPENTPLVYLFLKAREQSHLLFDPLQSASIEEALENQTLTDLSAFSLASHALFQSSFGQHRKQSRDQSWQPIVYAEAIRASRVRDINSAGLTLLCQSLIIDRQSPEADQLSQWLLRIRRTDQLLGCWELFSDSVNIANLLSTVNAYWGQHAYSKPDIPLYPGIAQRQHQQQSLPSFPEMRQPDWQRMDAKIASMLVWLDSHVDRFCMPETCKTRTEFTDHLKPLVECSLLLYAMTGERHRNHNSPYCQWAESMAKRLFWHIEQEKLIESFRLYPTTSLAMLVYPFLERAAGKQSPFHNEVRSLLEVPEASSHERTPMRRMDFHFLCRMMDAVPTPNHDLSTQLSDTLLFSSPNPLILSNDDVYDITHAFFYATQFGEKACPELEPVAPWLEEILPSLTLALSLDKDNDIAGELLLSGIYSRQPFGNCQALTLDILMDGITENGAVPGPERSMVEVEDEFIRCYHTTLVAALALLETRISYGEPWSTDEIPDVAESENRFLLEASEVLYTELGIEAEYGQNKVRKKEKELAFLVNAQKQTFAVSKYAMNSPAIQQTYQCQQFLASQNLTAPLLFHSHPDLTGESWSIREYLEGELWLKQYNQRLPEGYYQLGKLAARLHTRRPDNLPSAINQHWIDTLRQTEVHDTRLEQVIKTFLETMQTATETLLHGDLHLGNVIETNNGPQFIDFDECGLGAPEMDLAIALAYVNTDLEEFRICKEKIIQGYIEAGGKVSQTLLNCCIILAPVYVSEKQIAVFRGIEYHQAIENIRKIALRQTLLHLDASEPLN